ncbi:GmrSD restriction endonuclease domain-containing protein [Lysobacter fragariae]
MAELVSQPTSIQSVYGWFKDQKLFVNRRYQRKLVWTLEEKQRLIESLLKKYPIPAILVAEREGAPGTYEIIDGLQRLHAIVSFIESSFPTIDGKYFDVTHFSTAKARADEGIFVPATGEPKLTQAEVSTILDYTLALSVMRNASEAEINDVFGRINTYGHRLSDQSVRGRRHPAHYAFG